MWPHHCVVIKETVNVDNSSHKFNNEFDLKYVLVIINVLIIRRILNSVIQLNAIPKAFSFCVFLLTP